VSCALLLRVCCCCVCRYSASKRSDGVELKDAHKDAEESGAFVSACSAEIAICALLVLCSALRTSATLHYAAMICAATPNATLNAAVEQHSTAQHTAQYSTQRSAAQRSAAQHSTAHSAALRLDTCTYDARRVAQAWNVTDSSLAEAMNWSAAPLEADESEFSLAKLRCARAYRQAGRQMRQTRVRVVPDCSFVRRLEICSPTCRVPAVPHLPAVPDGCCACCALLFSIWFLSAFYLPALPALPALSNIPALPSTCLLCLLCLDRRLTGAVGRCPYRHGRAPRIRMPIHTHGKETPVQL
jgi:hypothetical protein